MLIPHTVTASEFLLFLDSIGFPNTQSTTIYDYIATTAASSDQL